MLQSSGPAESPISSVLRQNGVQCKEEAGEEKRLPGQPASRIFASTAYHTLQKAKLKVGKARPKAANQTDTTFRSKGWKPSMQPKRGLMGYCSHRTQSAVSPCISSCYVRPISSPLVLLIFPLRLATTRVISISHVMHKLSTTGIVSSAAPEHYPAQVLPSDP